MRSTRFWALLTAAVLAVSLLAAAALYLLAPAGRTARVYLDGELVRTIRLDRITGALSFSVEGPAGVSVIQAEPGRIRVSSADCPDQVCVRQGWVSTSAAPIVCLPNRLVIELTGGDPGPDAVSG